MYLDFLGPLELVHFLIAALLDLLVFNVEVLFEMLDLSAGPVDGAQTAP